ncbi:MAG: primosomal protein N', partial [Spirosomataceae bacterium]
MNNQNAQFPLSETTIFVEVLLPVPIPQTYTYRVPRELVEWVKVGSRAVVEFGKSRVLTAVIVKIHNEPPQKTQAKYLLELLDAEPMVLPSQIWLFNWVAEYYMCYPGEVLNVALPSGLKISSQSKIQYNPEFAHPELLSHEESLLMEVLLREDSLNYEEVGRLLDKQDVNKAIKYLVAKHAIIVFEEVKEKY